jgi:hypothetical protein
MKHLYSQFSYRMTGQQRGFRAQGRKLLPRDASECQYGKSYKERRKAIAMETAHNERSEREYLASVGAQPSRAEAQVVRARMALSTRRAAYVERFFNSMMENDDHDVYYQAAFVSLGNAQWRYFKALENDWSSRMGEEADEQILGYARG